MCGHRSGTNDYEFRSVLRCAFKNFITDSTSHSAGARITASIFNWCKDVTVKTRDVPLVHASCDIITALSHTHSRLRILNEQLQQLFHHFFKINRGWGMNCRMIAIWNDAKNKYYNKSDGFSCIFWVFIEILLTFVFVVMPFIIPLY